MVTLGVIVILLGVIVGTGVGVFVTVISGLLSEPFFAVFESVVLVEESLVATEESVAGTEESVVAEDSVVGTEESVVVAKTGTVVPTVSAAASARANTFFLIYYIPLMKFKNYIGSIHMTGIDTTLSTYYALRT